MASRSLFILLCGCAFVDPVAAGDLDAPAAPTAAGSAMYTLEDLYNRLNAGTAGVPRPGAFVEPTAGPGSTMHTLNDIMARMPALDNLNGATAADVLSGKTFWGLTGGAWGLQTGTATAGANVVGANGQLVMTIPNGLYSGNKTATASDASLTAGNIRAGVSIFGVAGNVVAASGNATAGEVLAGKTFSTAAGAQTGTLPTQTLSAASATVPAGYYAATTLNAVDADLAAGNIKAGVNLFGVAGAAVVATGDATAGEVLAGKTFSNAAGAQTGTLPTQALSAASATVPAGYYAATALNAVDADLAAGNIKTGVTLFGVTGTYTGPMFSAPFPMAKTGQTTLFAPGDDGDLEQGVAWPNPRFADNSNGTVTDNLTGLVWLKNANCSANLGGVNKTGVLTWANALAWTAALASGSCGLTDGSVAGQWRLPTIKELSSLVDAEATNPALLAGHPFTGIQIFYYWYWSSTTYAPGSDRALVQSFYEGEAYWCDKTRNDYVFVWPVRGGQ